MTLYRDILSKAIRIAWNYKILWFFGLFATAFGSASDIGLIINSVDDLSSQASSDGTMQTLLILKAWLNAFVNIFSLSSGAILFLLGMIIVLFTVVWLAFTSIGGIIGSAVEIEKGRRITFDGVWKMGMSNFFPILGINLIVKIIAIALLILGLPLLKIGLDNAGSSSLMLFMVYFTIIFLPIIFIVSVISKYAMIYVVAKKKPFDQSIMLALNLFKNNWLLSIEMAFVICGTYILGAFGYVIVAGILTFSLKLFALFGFIIVQSPWWQIIATLLALLLYSLILLFLGTFMAIVEYTAWTKLFFRLSEGKATAKLYRLAESLPKYLK